MKKVFTQVEKDKLANFLKNEMGIEDDLPSLLKNGAELEVDTESKEYTLNNEIKFTIHRDGILYSSLEQ